MSKARLPLVIALAAVTAFGVAPLMTGCVAQLQQKAAEDAAEKIVEDATGNNVDIGSNVKMPADWPAIVPVLSKELVLSTSSGDPGMKMWMVVTTTSDEKGDYQKVLNQLQGAGFRVVIDSAPEGNYSAVLTNDTYTVTISAAGGEMTYSIQEGNITGG